MKKIAIFLSFFLLLIPAALATQPQQATNRIPIYPLYRESMASNTNYTYTMAINPPDGISSVITAIIFFNAQINGQSQNFTLWVNGQPCNTPFYYIATAFSTAGNTQFYFDCSNRITQAGNYTITLRSAVVTGVVSGWLDLTYMNNPKMENLLVSGTEYQTGESATIFLQLKDSQGTPINDGQCYLDVYYPSYGNLSHPILYNDIGMLYKNDSNGIYYFDMVIPNVTGVYMLGASCAYSYDVNWIYPLEETVKKPTRTVTTGTFSGDTLVLNSFEDNQFTSCASVSKTCDAYYDFNTTEISNITNLSIYFMGETDKITTMTMMVWNWTSSSWITLPNTLTFAPTTTPTFPIGLGEMLTNNIVPSNHTINYTTKNVRIRLYTTGANSINEWDNWLSLKFLTQEGQIQELKGSGELHVSDALSNLTVNINQTQLNSILGNLTDIKNYLITINSTTYQINQSLYSDYLSLLSAINSVNITANQTLYYAIALNGSVFNLSQSQNAYFQQAIALLNSINYTLNTTLEYKLDMINGTVNQINQSQSAYYLSLLGAVGGVGATLNGSITQYLVYINGTTHNLSVNEFNHYLSLLEAINSVNYTANTTLENKLDYLNSTIIPLLYEINATTNTTLQLVAQINQTMLQDYLSLYNFLASLNTTLEYELNLINGTVIQINDTVNNLNFTIDLSQVLAAISQVNSTVNQNQQYLIGIDGSILNLNASEFQHYNDLYVILKDINYTTNTTLEYKLDLINYTTWQTWMMIQNLTIGNVSVAANVNWTEGVQLIWNASGQSQIDYNLLSLSDKGIQLTTETLTCLSNTTLQHMLNITNCIQGTCQNYNQAMTEACSWGCANNQCIPAPQFQYMFAIGFALILIGVIYAGWRIGK